MATRHLYVVRHGDADPFGELTDVGHRQAELLAKRLALLPVDAVWHSPLPRAARTARIIGEQLADVPVREAAELVDHIPYVPAEMPPAWAGFFDGFDADEAAAGARLADALTDRFARPADGGTGTGAGAGTHEVLVTHAYQVAWLMRHALEAPPTRWLGLHTANTALTAIQYRDGLPPTVLAYNDMAHLPADLRWTGFGPGLRP
ncbi:histidine phosphatase family protein [Streptomyces monticola]|uniref:Histidine phosphatase family protein n=1 Tax=Streptomyces monticola TaxID=2666263 RepID=A0ABW2JGD1_9ACTN